MRIHVLPKCFITVLFLLGLLYLLTYYIPSIKVVVLNSDGGKVINKGHISTNDFHQNWTILLTVNDAFFDFFQNWLWHYKKLHLDIPIIVIAEDDIVYRKLELLDCAVTVERSGHLSMASAASYDTPSFKKLVSTRPIHILELLKKGTDVIYADVDTVWLHNPIPYFVGSYDMWVQLDGTHNRCTGFIAIKNNNNTTRLIRTWKEKLQAQPNVNQKSFNDITYNSSNVRIKSLDIGKFPSGRDYFEKFNATQRSYAVVVHNNWIVGHDTKLVRFRKFNLWYYLNVSSIVEK